MKIHATSLRGLRVIELDVHGDARGNFREAYNAQRLGDDPELASFVPVQQNISLSKRGVIRGVHAEPWEKLIHVAYGEVFAAVVDLRPGEETFGAHETFSLDATRSLFVPRGFGNAFQVLSEVAAYSYLVNEHWNTEVVYRAVAFDDPDLGIPWPLPADQAIVSDKDRRNPSFRDYRDSIGAG